MIAGGVLAFASWSPQVVAAKEAQGALAPDFFSVALFEYPSQTELSHMRSGGVGSIRLVVSQALVERVQGTLDWREYDLLVAHAARSGIALSPVLFAIPTWMSPKPARMPIDSPAQEASWSKFVESAASRYGPGGTFWAANPGLVAQPMVHWEVWNEPNISEYVAGPPSARRYARLLRITDAGLHAGNPATRTIVAGLYTRPNRGAGPPSNVFLSRLYRVKGSKKWFDGVGLHPYGSSSKEVVNVVRRARGVMDAHKDRGATIWITELGWSTGGDRWAQSLYRATPPVQARRLDMAYRTLIRQRRELRLRQITWHVWRDYDGPVGPPGWIYQMGLFTTDGRPKPAWEALRKIAGGVNSGVIADPGNVPAPNPTQPEPPNPNPEPGPCLFPGLLC